MSPHSLWDVKQKELESISDSNLEEYILKRLDGNGSPQWYFNRDEEPEHFLLWSHSESGDQEYKVRFERALNRVTSILISNIRTGKNKEEALSRAILLAEKNKIPTLYSTLRDAVVEENQISEFGKSLNKEVVHHKSLSAQILRYLAANSEDNSNELDLFYQNLLKTPEFSYKATPLLGLINSKGIDSLDDFPIYITDLAKKYETASDLVKKGYFASEKDNVMWDCAKVLGCLIQKSNEEGEESKRLVNHPEKVVLILEQIDETEQNSASNLLYDSVENLLKRKDIFLTENDKDYWKNNALFELEKRML